MAENIHPNDGVEDFEKMATDVPRNLAKAEIRYSELKEGPKGMALGEDDYFLEIDRTSGKWRFRLRNLFDRDSNEFLTSWVALRDPEDLRNPRQAKPIREKIKAKWQNIDEITEKILIEIDAHKDGFEEKSRAREQRLEDKEEDFDELTIEKARNLLADPAFFYRLGKVFDSGFVVPKINKPCFIVEEERNKRLLGLLMIGAANLGMASLTKILGEPGTAKDTMLRMWLELLTPAIKCVERSYLTAASMRYSNEVRNADLLYIPDSPELRGELGRQMRFMRADDGGLISEYATRDPETNEMTTRVTRTPVKGVVTTSNVITGDTALESGMWTLRTNASETLTRRVKEEKLKQRAGKRRLFPDDELKVWQCAFHILLTEELPEQIPQVPFAENLAGLLDSDRSTSRRDPDKLCDLISLTAWVRRFQKAAEKRCESDVVDFYVAVQIGLDAITQTIAEFDEKEQLIFQTVQKAETSTEDITCRYVASKTDIAYKTCYAYLEKLIEKGVLLKDKKQGKNVYSSFSEKRSKTSLIGQWRSLETPEEIMEHVLSFFPEFSDSHRGKDMFSLIDPIGGQNVKVSMRQNGQPEIAVEDITYSYPYEKVRSPETNEEMTSKTEKKSEILLQYEKRKEISTFVWRRIKPAEPCELCRSFAVEYKLVRPDGTPLRRCETCFQKIRESYSNAVWKEAPEVESDEKPLK